MMTAYCAGFLLWLGGLPEPGVILEVPRSMLTVYSARQLNWAKRCAQHYNIRYRIVDR